MELSEEEKKAIDILRSFESVDLIQCSIYLEVELGLVEDLINRLQKELETLKSDKEQLVYENSLLKNEIKEMINYNVVKNIICDEFDVSEDEVDDLFGEMEE